MSPIILLLDDSRENHELLPRMLKGLPGMETIQTVCFASGGEALSWCRENEPDLCVVDYHMPGMDGITFITEARKLPRFGGIPMIMITGAADMDLRQRALMSGANDFLSRPVNADEFKARTRTLTKRGAGQALPRLLAGGATSQPASRRLKRRFGSTPGWSPRPVCWPSCRVRWAAMSKRVKAGSEPSNQPGWARPIRATVAAVYSSAPPSWPPGTTTGWPSAPTSRRTCAGVSGAGPTIRRV